MASDMDPNITPIPVALFGTDPQIAMAVSEKLLPDYEAVHICLDLPSALQELPALFTSAYPADAANRNTTTTASSSSPFSITQKVVTSSSTSTPASNPNLLTPTPVSGRATHALPSNGTTTTTTKVPRAVFFGGKLTETEYQAVVAAIKRARVPPASFPGGQVAAVHFIRVRTRDVLAAGSFAPTPDVVARVFRRKMGAALAREREQWQQQQQQQQQRRDGE